MADYPGQQPGGNPGNYPQRPPHGYPMQPQNQPMFRAQHQGYNRPSPSYPQVLIDNMHIKLYKTNYSNHLLDNLLLKWVNINRYIMVRHIKCL